MRIFLIIVGLLAALVLAMWIAGRGAQHNADNEIWPAGLGQLKTAPQRFPAHGTTPAATTLNRLVEPLGLDLIVLVRPELKHDPRTVTVLQYVTTELERNAAVEPPPRAVAQYMADHAEHFAAVRRQAREGGTIAFAVDVAKKEPPKPDVAAIYQLNRLLLADALVRSGNGDAVAWDDLEAAWRVAQSLFERPEEDSQILAVMTQQNIAEAARRMPLPVPTWLTELREVDARTRYLASLQAESWQMMHRDNFFAVVIQLSARIAGEQRWAAEQLEGETRCVFDGALFFHKAADHLVFWKTLGQVDRSAVEHGLERLFRMPAEFELTDRVLGTRSGAAPVPQSACPDGDWVYEADPPGSTTIHFSEELEPPLEFVISGK